MLMLIIFITFVALVFDFFNGVNDAANSIATIVTTRVLSPLQAVAWAAFFNFVAAFGFGVHVATTIGKGIVMPSAINEYVILSGLIGAILYTVIATAYGFPISVSHALIGGLVGSAITKDGMAVLVPHGLYRIAVFIVLSPFIGLFLGAVFMVAVLWIFRRTTPGKVDRHFRRLQLLSSAFYSLGHGTNDAQKTMGIISILLFSTGYLGDKFYVPFWVVLLCHFSIAMGTLMGGWKVIRTLGTKLTKLRPVGGFCAEGAAAATLLFTAVAGIPVSTTHTITGAIVGVGSVKRLSAVRWGVTTSIVWAWVLTIPCSAIVAGVSFWVIDGIRRVL